MKPTLIEKIAKQFLPNEYVIAERCMQDETFQNAMTPDYEALCALVRKYIIEKILAPEKETASPIIRLAIEETTSSLYYSMIAMLCGEQKYGVAWSTAIVLLQNLTQSLKKLGYTLSAPIAIDMTGSVVIVLSDSCIEKTGSEQNSSFDEFLIHLSNGGGDVQNSVDELLGQLRHREQRRRRHD